MSKPVRKLRFKEFEANSSYQRRKFSDIFSFSIGKNIKQNEASPEFETPCVRYGELYHMYGEVITKVFNKTNLDRSELIFSEGDEILLPSAGEDPLDIGSASALTVENVAIGRTINILKPIKANTYSQVYVSYYINQKLRRKISTLAKGVSISNVYNSDLRRLEILLPNLPEQNKIASFIFSVDTKIQQLTNKKKLLEQYKKGVMQKIFKQEIRFKDEKGKSYSKWFTKKLGEVTYKVGEKNKENLHLPVFSINNKQGFLPQGEQFDGVDSSARGYDISMYRIIYKNTFAYNPARINVGSLGYSGDLTKILISSLYVCFKTKDSLLSDQYLLHYLRTYEFNKSVLRSVEGGVREYLFYENFASIRIPIPEQSEQKKIADFLSSIDSKIELVDKQIEKVNRFKKGLLQQMFV